MKTLKKDLVAEIKNTLNLADLVAEYVPLTQRDVGNFWACCPFHGEKTPSFHVVPARGFFKCFGCQVQGDGFEFLRLIEGLSFGEAKRKLAARLGIAVPDEDEITEEERKAQEQTNRLKAIMEAATQFYEFHLWQRNSVKKYLKERGVKKVTVEEFRMGYAPDSWDSLSKHLLDAGFDQDDIILTGMAIKRESSGTIYDRFRNRLMFPIWDEGGDVIAFSGRTLGNGTEAKYMNSPEGILFSKSNVLYALNKAKVGIAHQKTVIISEGCFDTIMLHQAGFKNTAAILGTALTSRHISLLTRVSPEYVYLCLDNDSAGLKAALKAAWMFVYRKLEVRVVSLPENKDPADFLLEGGDLNACLKKAMQLPAFRMNQLLAGQDLTLEQDWVDVMKKAVDVLVDLPLPVDRTVYIAWLVNQWGKSNPEERYRCGLFENSLLRTVQTSIRRRIEKLPPEENLDFMQNEFKNTGPHRIEVLLIGVILSEIESLPGILYELPLDYWGLEVHQEILSVLSLKGRGYDTNIIPPELSEKAAETYSNILIETANLEYDGDSVLEMIDRIKTRFEREQLAEQLQEIAERVGRGEVLSEEEQDSYRVIMETYQKP